MAKRFVVHGRRQAVAYSPMPTNSDYPIILDLRRLELTMTVVKDSLIVQPKL
ncbi:hypothetical protein N836_16105 [Leptolyngbya sp. Heron Island J]|uniref:hypothetical protein n=1 Tax=Leptolyngbya sp. Heron Island J TaxID=1385935 RepID=UPI0003B963DE|nr:hypothetical protein [Leptolyngbya sp. Heron Island J]ESA34628.1 hypothetical protein N836_16105 [Leptolyngbya sp. Heron Island J]